MKGIYPGTFDPVTFGHLDIIHRGCRIVDHLVVAVGDNPRKVCTFDVDTRVRMIRESIGDSPNVEVTSFRGLLVDAARAVGATVIIRGLRAISDYETEVQMAIMNRALSPDLDSIFLVAGPQYSFISSSLIKEIAHFGGDMSPFVPESVINYYNRCGTVIKPE